MTARPLLWCLAFLTRTFCGRPPERATGGPIDTPVLPADWAFRSLGRPPVPASRFTRNGSPNPIDAFIDAKLAQLKLSPSPEADKRSLLRRVYFDLIGLPPALEQMRAFLPDKSPRAYARLVHRSPAS